MTARVLGIADCVRNLKKLGDTVMTRVTRKAVRSATAVILRQVRRTTYSGDRDRRTGLLKASLGMSVSAKSAGLIVGKVVMRPVDVTGKSRVAQNVRRKRKAKQNNATEMAAFYWRFLERGTKKRTTKGGANRGSVNPSPWIEPAFDSTNAEALDKFKQVFERETEAEARKLYQQQGRPR